MSSYQGLSTNNVTAKNSAFQSERDLKQNFVSELLLNHQNIIEIGKNTVRKCPQITSWQNNTQKI
jgi:hypothetical protein